MSKSLPAAYFDTVFECILPAHISDFWVITAYHPKGENADRDYNTQADQDLHEEIIQLGHTPIRIHGMSPDTNHVEPSWGFTCDVSMALDIARRYRQLAVYHFHPDGIDLVETATGQRHALSHPERRLRDPRQALLFTLFVGSSPGCEEHDPDDHDRILKLVWERFPGFTIQRAEGFFEGKQEATLLIHISTREPEKVLGLAQELCRSLCQTGIGISHNGIYQRVRDWSDHNLILAAFGISQ